MKITERRVYRGPNLYAHFPVIRLTLELGPLEAAPSATIPQFNEQLLARLPSLNEHGCSYGEPGGFVRRLHEDGGTWMGHILEHMMIELQCLTGADVTFGKTRGTGVEGEYHVVYAYDEEQVGLTVADLATEMVHQTFQNRSRAPTIREDFDFDEEIEELTYAGAANLVRRPRP